MARSQRPVVQVVLMSEVAITFIVEEPLTITMER